VKYFLSILQLVADDRVKVALGAFIITLLAVLGVPKDKQDQIEKLIYTGGILATALIAGLSYEKGKANEGTVPEGRRSVYDNANVTVVPPSPIPAKPTDPHPLMTDATGKPPAQGPDPNPPKETK
jgi:hypothetical protein